MSVAYTSDVDKVPATGSSFTYTSFAVSGANPVIVIIIGLSSTTATVSSVACSAGLSSGTPVQVKTIRNSTAYLSIWVIPAPSGTGTITVTLSASVPWQSNAILLSGADQTTPSSTSDAVSASGTQDKTSVLTPSNLTASDASVGAGVNVIGGNPTSVSPNQTFLNNNTAINLEAGYRIGAGAVTMNWDGVDPAQIDASIAIRIINFSNPTPYQSFANSSFEEIKEMN